MVAAFEIPARFPRDWYWVSIDGRVYSAERNALVPADDADFAAFKEEGNTPTRWPLDVSGHESDAELWAVLQPYGLGPTRRFTFLEFLALFTGAEQVAIAGSADAQVRLFLLMAAGATYIDLDDARTSTGLDLMISKALIDAARKTAVLAGQAPA